MFAAVGGQGRRVKEVVFKALEGPVALMALVQTRLDGCPLSQSLVRRLAQSDGGAQNPAAVRQPRAWCRLAAAVAEDEDEDQVHGLIPRSLGPDESLTVDGDTHRDGGPACARLRACS